MTKWEKTFEFSGPVGEVWESFVDGSSPHRVWDPENAYLSAGAIQVEFTEQQRHQLLSWEERTGDQKLAEFSVVFTEIETGTRISITSQGFGDHPEDLHQARLRGWTEMLWDLELFFRTGVMLDRLHRRRWGRLGLRVIGNGPGLEVRDAEGVGGAAGLKAGDLVVRIGGAPVFEVGDLWLLESALPEGSDVSFEFFRGSDRLTAAARLPDGLAV